MQAQQNSLQGKCLTCLGTGEVGSLNGPIGCTDCDGTGRPPRRHLLTERRIREIETRFRADSTQAGIDVTWLAFELRRAREALMKILTMTGEPPMQDKTALQLWHTANNVLGVYEPEGLRGSDDTSATNQR
ncbi:MAG: hypothetical protein SF187_26175 [Deltaproteobacteria bacterium]|nr:hypothetical protein [Deltaproteobacteria bacterium]